MTYRERIATSKRRAALALFGSIGLIAVCGLLVANEIISEIYFAAAFLPFIAVVWFYHFGIRCPRCKENLSYTVGPVGGPFNVSRKIRFCPYCGVAFDTELGSSERA